MLFKHYCYIVYLLVFKHSVEAEKESAFVIIVSVILSFINYDYVA